MSLRRRLVAGLVVVAAVLVATNLALASTVESVLLQRVDQQLVDVATRPVFGGAPGRNGGGGRGGGARPVQGEETLSEFFIAVASAEAATFRSLTSAFADDGESPPELDAAAVRARATSSRGRPQPFTVDARDGTRQWRLIAVTDPRNGGTTVVGLSLAAVDATIDRIRTVQLLGTSAALAALGLVSWWMVRLGVQPLEAMAADADAIAGGDLTRRVGQPPGQTEAGRLGAALNGMLDRIEEAFRARAASEERVRRFAADASHELRTPLTSIRGYAELYRAGGLRDEVTLADAMRRVEQEAARMGALVEDLLTLARLDEGRVGERQAVQVHELARDAALDLQAIQPDRPVHLDLAPTTVVADEPQLRQVLTNLLGNVRVHTPSATPVTVRVSSCGPMAVIEVEDTGPGMDAETAAHVFERFYRADPSRARSGGGTGLGLSIVAAIVDAQGGSVTVRSEIGRGSTFRVEVPRA